MDIFIGGGSSSKRGRGYTNIEREKGLEEARRIGFEATQ